MMSESVRHGRDPSALGFMLMYGVARSSLLSLQLYRSLDFTDNALLATKCSSVGFRGLTPLVALWRALGGLRGLRECHVRAWRP